jgi:biopolymer transport protein ExbB/TolQ
MAAVTLAATRAADRADQQHGRGLTLLATISATAPFVGVIGTVYWLLSFPGSGERTSIMFAELRIMSHSLWFTAAGLLIAAVSYAGYRYFRERREQMRGEMRAAILEMLNTLRTCFADKFPAELATPYRESRFASAERAMERTARSLSRRLRRRIRKLTSIAATAPMIGMLASLFGFLSSFRGEDDRAVIPIIEGLSLAFVPMAFALIVAIIATWSRNYLLSTSADMESEVRVSSNELLNTLALKWRNSAKVNP